MATITTSTMHLLPASSANDGYLPRSKAMPLWFVIPAVLAGTSWLAGGIPFLTDASFIALTAIGIGLLAMEYVNFPRRFGIGGMLIFGGFLTWFCYDYLKHWVGFNFRDGDPLITQAVVAKTAFFHMVFIGVSTIGLLLPTGRRPVKIIQSIPEPNQSDLYYWLILSIFALGISPYFLFTNQHWYTAIYDGIVAGRAGGGTEWTIGRTGRLNYSWGGYIAQLGQVGQVGGQLAVFYALLVCRNLFRQIVCWLIWTLWLLLAVGTGTRGAVAFMILPIIAIIYLKYQSWAVMFFKKLSVRAYVYGGILLFVMVVLVQLQGQYRTLGYRDVTYSKINVMELSGNSMFSEGLSGWALIPEKFGYISNRFPGEAIIRPMPETLWNLCYKIIPRALWHDKPLDPVEEWYNDIATQGRGDATVSTGIVGEWYFRYGPIGLIQGGILFGWLARVSERALQTAAGRPMALLMSLGLATFLFRAYRNFNYQDFYPLVLGGAAFYVLIKMFNQMNPKVAS